jgi:pyridoxine kinase
MRVCAMNVLSIQSHVAYGHVGNSAAAFPLQRLGFEVWRINTVQFSNHTGYGHWTGQVFDASHVRDLVDGIEARGALKACNAVLSGYLGDAALGEVILDAVARVREANPEALYLCDPVMGDFDTGLYVRDGIPEFLRAKAVPAADVITPNVFELETLTGTKVTSLADAVEAARGLLALGPKIVLVTSLVHRETAPGMIEMLLVTAEANWRVATPFLAIDPLPNGAGDTVAALFLAHLLNGLVPSEAMGRAAASIFAVMEATRQAGTRELRLIAAQDQLAEPDKKFPVERLG